DKDTELEPDRKRERRVLSPQHVGEVQRIAERGDEQAAAERQQQCGRRNYKDVERRELRGRATGDVDDGSNQQEVEDTLQVQEVLAERSLVDLAVAEGGDGHRRGERERQRCDQQLDGVGVLMRPNAYGREENGH